VFVSVFTSVFVYSIVRIAAIGSLYATDYVFANIIVFFIKQQKNKKTHSDQEQVFKRKVGKISGYRQSGN